MQIPLTEFTNWEERIRPEISEVSDILSERLSDSPEDLIRDLTQAEVWNSRMGSLLAQANSWLDRYRLIAMPDKEDGKSEAHRKMEADKEVSPIRLVRDTLEHFCDSIKQRLILGESILSYHKQQYATHNPRIEEKIF